MPSPRFLYQSPPNSGGNDGATPTVYDSKWPTYTNLTPNQVGWFQVQPQYLVYYAKQCRHQKEIAPITVQLANISVTADMSPRGYAQIATLKQSLDNHTLPAATVTFVDWLGNPVIISAIDVNTLFTAAFVNHRHAAAIALGNAINSINAPTPTITSMAQVDAVFAVIP